MFECDHTLLIITIPLLIHYCKIHMSVLPGLESSGNNRLYVTLLNNKFFMSALSENVSWIFLEVKTLVELLQLNQYM